MKSNKEMICKSSVLINIRYYILIEHLRDKHSMPRSIYIYIYNILKRNNLWNYINIYIFIYLEKEIHFQYWNMPHWKAHLTVIVVGT